MSSFVAPLHVSGTRSEDFIAVRMNTRAASVSLSCDAWNGLLTQSRCKGRSAYQRNSRQCAHSMGEFCFTVSGGKFGRRVASSLVLALDAAMPFDFEAIQRKNLQEKQKLKVGIVGFGNFGQFIAKRILNYNHAVIAFSRSDYGLEAESLGVKYFRDMDDFCEDHPDVVLLATSILSTDKVLKSMPLQRLKRSTLFVDVLSVKEFPRALFLQNLPPQFDILCTHPMFGPESGKGSWEGLPFVFERVRVGGSRSSRERCQKFLDVFEKEGCRMVEMSCQEHDKFAAGSQFVTHTVGRLLGKLQLESTPINTKGYETLLQLVENTTGDSFDLYYGLFMYNVNATEQLHNLERAFDDVKKQLFDQLHDVLRAQLFATSQGQQEEAPSASHAKQAGQASEGLGPPLALPPPQPPTSASSAQKGAGNGSPAASTPER